MVMIRRTRRREQAEVGERDERSGARNDRAAAIAARASARS
jgi:hypothetical protein